MTLERPKRFGTSGGWRRLDFSGGTNLGGTLLLDVLAVGLVAGLAGRGRLRRHKLAEEPRLYQDLPADDPTSRLLASEIAFDDGPRRLILFPLLLSCLFVLVLALLLRPLLVLLRPVGAGRNICKDP